MTRGNWLPGQAGHDIEHNNIDKLLRERLSASNCGVIGNGSVDDTAAIQAQITALAESGGGELWFPNGTYKTTTPITLASNVKLIFASRAAQIVNNVSDVFIGSPSNFEMHGGTVIASAGHIFAPTAMNKSHLHDCVLAVTHPQKSVFTMDGGYVGNVVERCQLDATVNHTVPVWKQISHGNVNGNTWRDLLCHYSGNYVFWLENVMGQNFAYDNRFENITFEVPVGGSIKLLGCNHAMIENCHEYDLQLTGAAQRDLIYLGASTGSECRNCTITNSGRRGGDLAASVYDINLAYATRTKVDSCGATSDTTYRTNVGQLTTGTVWINDGERGTLLP